MALFAHTTYSKGFDTSAGDLITDFWSEALGIRRLMMHTAVWTDALFPVVFAIQLDSLSLSIKPIDGSRISYILLNSIVVRPRDHSQPNSIASIQDKSVEGADTRIISSANYIETQHTLPIHTGERRFCRSWCRNLEDSVQKPRSGGWP